MWVKSQYVCPNCGVHLAIGAYYRLSTVLDQGTFKELNPDIAPQDVLHFPDYKEKLAAATVKTGLKEAAVTATGKIGGVQTVAAVLDSRFFMGSMSTAVGEKITCAIEYAVDKHLLLVIFSASGGARIACARPKSIWITITSAIRSCISSCGAPKTGLTRMIWQSWRKCCKPFPMN